MSGTPLQGEHPGERQGVVPADRDEVVEAERLDVVEHDGREVVGPVGAREPRALRFADERGEPVHLHLAGIRARGVEDGATGAVDRPSVRAVERPDVLRIGLRAGPHVGEALPATADTEHLVAQLARAVDDALDDRVEPRDVAPTGQDADTACHRTIRLTVPRSSGGYGTQSLREVAQTVAFQFRHGPCRAPRCA